MRSPFYLLALALLLTPAAVWLGGCDSGISGTALDNQPPDTELSVRDSSLVDNIGEQDRLSSTVLVSWSGTDPDGYVDAYEIRYYDPAQPPAADEGWSRTAETDSLVLLPIPRGERMADVVVEVRAIDNEGLRDPEPARTVFPIRNSPPTLRLSAFELPPDTTFPIFSVGLVVDDPEGMDNLDRIEVAFNDSLNFTALPADAEFLTFVGQFDRDDPAMTTDAAVYTGRAFQRADVSIPGLRLNDTNILYVRAVDQTDTTSTLQRLTLYVQRPTSDLLFVNDYRTAGAPIVQAYHLDLLRTYLPEGMPVDVWDISRPVLTGTTGMVVRSDALPPVPDPTLRQLFAQWEHIYWVTNSSTAGTSGFNFPFAAGAMDLFFERGGTMMVHTPIALPADPADNLGNAAILLLPLSNLIAFPDSLRPGLRLSVGADVIPQAAVPGTDQPLPSLETTRFIINALPFEAEGANVVPLYDAAFRYTTREGSRQGTWPGPSTVAALSADRRVGLFALQMVDEASGEPILQGADGDPDAPERAIHLMLRGLGFPGR